MSDFVSRFLLFEYVKIGRGIYLLLCSEIAVRVPELDFFMCICKKMVFYIWVLWVLF